ncbi:uncharacterized protein K02A2.6-like isoform X2 [Zophobas morio]|uniref:uncharacterized protein K02A2.6-like isoform X2 n=1 Tax=Zophobas morio TaxID=2755281 RepID=UPI0030830549
MIGSIQNFNPRVDSWILYQEQLEQYFEINDIKDTEASKKRVAALISLIGQDTYKILRDLCTPKAPKDKTYEELCNHLKKHFSPTTCVFRERLEFYDAKQLEEETVNDWHVRIHNLSTNCDFGTDLGNVLKDKFVCGMRKGPIRDRLCEEKPSKSLENLLEIALARETTIKADKEINLVRKERWNPEFSGNANNTSGVLEGRRNGNNPRRWSCKACGAAHTGNQRCKYATYKCNSCHKVGHLAKVCRSRATQNAIEAEEDFEEAQIFNLDFQVEEPMKLQVSVNNVRLPIQIDCGATLSVITEECYNQYFKTACPLFKSRLKLKSYSGDTVANKGYIKATLRYKNVVHNDFIFHVVDKTGDNNLLGRDFLSKFKFTLINNDCEINSLGADTKIFADEFNNLFSEQLGCYKHRTFILELKSDSTQPIYHKPRALPLSYKSKVEAELQRLEEKGVISPIEHGDWGTPIVPVLKANGSIRICGDYKVTVNRHLREVKYPLPRIEEIFMQLNGGKSFTKIDLSDAYNQLVVDQESAKLLAWSTHKGLYKVNRLPFGIVPASAIFQRTLEQTLSGLGGVTNFLDDILVTGKTRQEHKNNLRQVFLRLKEAGFVLKLSKCEFCKNEIKYLGYVISREDLKTNKDKIRAMLEAPRPRDVRQVKSFVGLVNYYSRFVPEFAGIMRPLYELLKSDRKFAWDQGCEKAFNLIKQEIASDRVLEHFDPSRPIILSTDASHYGIAAILSHKTTNGDLKPIAFISRTLSKAEGNYSVLDKEALAIYWATSKLRTYLLGHSFEIHTDHKPLIYLFGEQKGIPQMASARFQRWALYLSGFQYKIKYVKGQENSVADMLSRHPLYSETPEGMPVTHTAVSRDTRRDPTLSKIVKFVTEGWPEQKTDDFLKPFVQRKDEITCEQGCLMWGYRVIVPRKLQHHLLEELHSSHLDIVKMKSIARAYFWWPNLDKDIENIARSCIPCNKVARERQKAIPIPWNRPTRPWQRVHIDFLGPINNSHYLIMLDAYSKWPEIFKMNSITSAATISKIRETCARWGIPETLVSDNGTQLTSEEFSIFLKRNGIRHVTGPPYKPETNGAAENAVKSFKKGFKAALLDQRNRHVSTDTLVSRYLFWYRNSTHCQTNETPAKLMLGRHLHTTLNLMRPDTNRDTERQFNHKGRDSPTFEKGSIVWIRDYRKPNTKTWQEAKVIDILGPRNYTCELPDGQKWRRHVDQMRKRIEAPSTEDSKSETVQSANTNQEVPQRKMPGEPTMPSATPPLPEQTPSLEPQPNPIPVIPVRDRPKRSCNIPARYRD